MKKEKKEYWWRGAISASRKLEDGEVLCLFPDGTWEINYDNGHTHDTYYQHITREDRLDRDEINALVQWALHCQEEESAITEWLSRE